METPTLDQSVVAATRKALETAAPELANCLKSVLEQRPLPIHSNRGAPAVPRITVGFAKEITFSVIGALNELDKNQGGNNLIEGEKIRSLISNWHRIAELAYC